MKLKIKRLDKTVNLPDIARQWDVGFDLRSGEDVILKSGEKKIIGTGLSLAVPVGYAGLVWDRSGMAGNHSIHILAGVIDPGFRGEIGVVMINLGKEEFRIEKNMKIAQILIHQIFIPEIVEVEDLDDTERGDNWLWSSGK